MKRLLVIAGLAGLTACCPMRVPHAPRGVTPTTTTTVAVSSAHSLDGPTASEGTPVPGDDDGDGCIEPFQRIDEGGGYCVFPTGS